MPIYHIPADEVLAPLVISGRAHCKILIYGKNALGTISRRRRAWFVKIVDDVDVHGLTTIHTVAAPIVDNIVAEVNDICQGKAGAGALSKTWIAAIIIGNQVVMKACVLAAPNASVAVFSRSAFI